MGMTPGTAMDWETIAREGTLMSVRAVHELLVQSAFHITEWALLSFLFERFIPSLGTLELDFSFFSSFPVFGRTGTSFGKHPIVGIE
jgi:hypothetical protein